MKRRATPFSIGLSLALLVIALGVVTAAFYMHQALALSNKGADNVDFPPSSHYTLSDTVDVASATSMTVAVFVPGAKPTAGVAVGVTYQSDVSAGPACDDNNHQGWAGATFTGGSGDVGGAGIPTRQSAITIPTSSWVADGTGFKALVTGTLATMTNNCGSAGGDGNHVNFTLTAPSGYTLGPAGAKRFAVNQGTYGVTFNSTYPAGVSSQGYTTYNVPFAPQCTQTTGGSTNVQIYDMDNTGHPVVQPTPAVVKVIDTTTGATVNNNSFTGGEGNGQTAIFTFTYAPQHAYKLQMTNVNLNNILQIQLPFDSVNAVINCVPKGEITSTVAGSCTSVAGYMYDTGSPATQLSYYVYTNPASTPPTTYSAYPTGNSSFWGAYTANLANPSGTPSGTPANHGFNVAIPATVTGHGYNGPWVDNHYYIYAKDAVSTTLTLIDSVDVPAGTCASLNCGTTNFALDSVGDPDSFTVNMKMTGTTTPPPGNPTFSITVTGSGVGTNSQTFNNVTSNGVTGGSVYSNAVSFTPAGAGSYSVSWSYYGQNGCGAPPSTASYTPYFGVLSGDIAAGAGFGSGSCTENNADIESWNNNADASPNYAGAGSELSALATGDITNFVSGMGLSGGAAAQSGHGLSFANSNNSEGNTPPNYGGNFGTSITCIDDYYSTKATANPISEPSNLPSGIFNGLASGSYTANPGGAINAVTLGESTHAPLTVGLGETVTLYVQGNVYIDSNIVYQTPYAMTTVPRFNLYVQGNIYIDPSVTELHGVYIAQKSTTLPGNITTCADSPTATTESWTTCKNKLLVVGSMAAQGQLRLTRTHGNLVGVPAASVPAEPAETFQYSPEMWLNAPPLTSLPVKAYTSLPPVL